MNHSICSRPVSNAITRRQMLHGLGATLGSLAFTKLLASEGFAAPAAPLGNLLAPKAPMFPAKAKNVIMLFMEGGPGHMDTYELAYRMQMEVPDVIDLKGETEATREMYGMNDKDTATFGRQCLLARRLVEKGVRFVQIFSGGWDSHDYLERAHTERIRSVDRGMAALIRDLKQRGMLDDTLVIWCGEFGRTPDNNKRGGVYSLGRGHNNKAMTMLLAGGGVKKGSIVGATDELGLKAVEVVHPIRDMHVTLLNLLGLDDNKLTYYHAGRYKQLSQFGGQVIKELIA